MNKIVIMIKNAFSKNGAPVAYALMTLCLAIIPEKCFENVKIFSETCSEVNITINRVLFCAFIFSFVKVIYGYYRKKRTHVTVRGDDYIIKIEYGDIFECYDGKVVINFDECYTTKVADNPSDIKKDTLCGQYLQKNSGLDIKNLICKANVKPMDTMSRYNKQIRYESGTIVPNGDDLLLAFAHLDENGRGCLTYEEYLKCLNKLWEQINIYHGTKDVYVPILGSLITIFDKKMTQQQLLDTMIHSYILYDNKLRTPYKLHIVCREREGFSINNAYGVD